LRQYCFLMYMYCFWSWSIVVVILVSIFLFIISPPSNLIRLLMKWILSILLKLVLHFTLHFVRVYLCYIFLCNFYHPRSGVVMFMVASICTYVSCLCVCMSVYNTTTFENFDRESSFLVCM